MKKIRKNKKAALMLAVMGLSSISPVVDNGFSTAGLSSFINRAEASDSVIDHGDDPAWAEHEANSIHF